VCLEATLNAGYGAAFQFILPARNFSVRFARTERSEAMSVDDSVVFIVDDDPSMCEALTKLLGTVGLRAQPFKTAQEFLGTKRPDTPGCERQD
jgi:ActR/RegA family two-component response regulator